MPTRTVRMTWTDLNSGVAQEEEFRVYRSLSTFDADSLPSVLATLPPDTETYDDDTAEEGETYFYAVASVKGSIVALSSVESVAVGFLTSEVRFSQLLSSADLDFTPDLRGFTYQGFSTPAGAKTVYARSSGKFYFEAVVVSTTKYLSGNANLATVGLLRVDWDFPLQSLDALGACVYVAGTTQSRMWVNGVSGADLGVLSNGDVFGLAVDLDAGLLWARRNAGNWNASGSADPETATGGVALSDFAGRAVTPVGTVWTTQDALSFNFKSADFVYTAPTGFTGWPMDVSDDNSSLGNAVLNSQRNNNVTLSGGDLTVTRGGSSGSARARDYQSSGKYYVEFTVGSWGSSSDCVGLSAGQATQANILTNGTQGCYCYRSGALWVAGSASGVSLGTVANGQRVDVAVDMDAKLVWFRRNGGNWNDNASADPATGAGGLSFSHVGLTPCVGVAASGANVTANFGDSAFAGSVPSGFTGGWPGYGKRPPDTLALWVGAIE